MTIGSALERALSLSAGVVAIAAVGITLYEARIEREHQKVSVWPYINQGNAGGGGAYRRIVRNVGLGPALIRSFQVTVDGRPVRRWGEVREALVGAYDADSAAAARTYYSTLRHGTVLVPGEMLEIYTIPDSALARRFFTAVQGDRLRTRVCYCSLYDDCWISDSQSDEPTPIAACTDDAKRDFAQ